MSPPKALEFLLVRGDHIVVHHGLIFVKVHQIVDFGSHTERSLQFLDEVGPLKVLLLAKLHDFLHLRAFPIVEVPVQGWWKWFLVFRLRWRFHVEVLKSVVCKLLVRNMRGALLKRRQRFNKFVGPMFNRADTLLKVFLCHVICDGCLLPKPLAPQEDREHVLVTNPTLFKIISEHLPLATAWTDLLEPNLPLDNQLQLLRHGHLRHLRADGFVLHDVSELDSLLERVVFSVFNLKLA